MAIGTADITRPVDDTAPSAETASAPAAPSIQSLLEQSEKRTKAFTDVFGTPEQQKTAIDVAKDKQAGAEATSENVYQNVVVPALVRQVQAARQPLPAVPQALPEPPVPSQQARPFLDVGEKNSLSAVVQGLGLMAQLAMAGKAPQAALGALTGAMNGWREGDTDRANREWRQYLATVDKIRHENAANIRTFEASMQIHGANIQAAQAEIIASLYGAGHYEHAAQVARDGVVTAYSNALEYSKHVDRVVADTTKLIEARETRMLRLEMEKTRMQSQEEWHKALIESREADRKSREATAYQSHLDRMERFRERRETDAAVAELTPAGLELATQQYYTLGTLPPMGMGAKGVSKRVEIINKAGAMAQEAGTTGADFVARQQFAKGSQNELNTLMRQRGQIMAFAKTADQNLDAANELAGRAAEGGAPVLNRWIQAGRRKVEGDPDVTQFNIYTDRAVAEIARLTSSATGGGVSTDSARREAQELLSTAYTPEQFNAAVKALKNEVQFRRKGFEDQIEAIQNNVRRLAPSGQGAAPSGTIPPAPKAGMVRVRRKSDGQTGWLEKKDLGSELYEIIEGR
jgi:hypothetical protein